MSFRSISFATLLASLPFSPLPHFRYVLISRTGRSVLCCQVLGGGLWLGSHGDLLVTEEIASLLCCYVYGTYPPILLTKCSNCFVGHVSSTLTEE